MTHQFDSRPSPHRIEARLVPDAAQIHTLAKSVFQLHAVDERGKPVLRKTLKRTDVTNFFAKLSPCVIGVEACGGAHFWARKLSAFGHTVRLMAPQSCSRT